MATGETLDSSDASSGMSLSCSFSSFEGIDLDSEVEEDGGHGGIVELYQYEPNATSSESDESESDQDDGRLHNTDWLAYTTA